MGRQRNRKTSRATLTPAATSAYYLRSIPSDLWESVTAKAKADGRNIRWVILHALRDWLDGSYEPAHKEANPVAPNSSVTPAWTRPRAVD